MKTTGFTVLLALAFGSSIYAQGTVAFLNNSRSRVCLFPDTFVPVGSTFLAELMYAPDGTAPGEFDAIAVRLGGSAGFAPLPGYFYGGNRTAPTATPGGFGMF